MKRPKDLFSEQSENYSKFRPEYPLDFVEEIIAMSTDKKNAWDCGTGNGQVAALLAGYFGRVDATDISATQLENATRVDNIHYGQARAEHTDFKSDSFDLITVAQAAHWFDFEEFYKEVRRVSKPNGLLALWGYGLVRVAHRIDELIDHFYREIIGKYWCEERKHVEQAYENIPFPFPKLYLQKEYTIKKEFQIDSFTAYIRTWSSVQKFIKAEGFDPVEDLTEELKTAWNDGHTLKTGVFPLFYKIGRVIK